MTSTRELDALVAEKVLGMHVERLRPAWYHGGQTEVLCFYRPLSPLMVYSLDADACNAMMFRNGVDESDGFAPPLPFYSDNIAAAWTVVEELNSEWAFILSRRIFGDGPKWSISIYETDEDGYQTRDLAIIRTERSAPLAICHAALAA